MRTNNLSLLSPYCQTAKYKTQRPPQFQGNPLIEALPETMSDEELFEMLTKKPPFEIAQRDWETHERMHMLVELKNFNIPLSRHIECCRSLDAIHRGGYVGRAPLTPEHTKITQKIHDLQTAKKTFSQAAKTHTPQLSTSLIGISGMGKTSLIKRWCAQIAPVIHHPKLHVYQVPYLHIEMPSDGSSIKGLAHGILQKLDELIPGANYYEDYAIRGRPGADTLMRSVARIMHRHYVGILICDEVQNLANSRKGQQTVMTELVSACNDLRVPILFIGTTKANKILSLDFRQARRSCGHGISTWERLPSVVPEGEINEWKEFVQILWEFQWVRKPVTLTEHLLAVMYRFSQGIIDVAITLFASAQARAMLDGSETITPELISKVFTDELGPLHIPIDALHFGDFEAVAQFDDISSECNLSGIISNMTLRARSKASPLYKVTSDDPSYTSRIASSLVAMGFGPEEATSVAQETVVRNQKLTLIEGSKKAMEMLTVPSKIPKSQTKLSEPTSRDEQSFNDRPGDFRRAIGAARKSGAPILHEMKRLNLIKPLTELLEIT